MAKRISKKDRVSPFLKEAAAQGQYDSTGAFTTSVAQGLQKLASFQLAPRSTWILKIVQAAVAWGAQGLVVRQSSTKTTFVFDQAHQSFPVFELQQALLSTEPSPIESVGHLTVALRAVGQGDGRSWRLTTGRPQALESLAWDGLELTRLGDSRGNGRHVTLEVDFPKNDRGRRLGHLFRSAGRAGEEYLEVVKRAYICPIPLTFDGRRIDRGEHKGSFETGTHLAYICFGVAPPGKLDEVPELGVPGGVKPPNWRPTDRFSDGRLFCFDGNPEQTETSAFWQLHFHYQIENLLIMPGFDKKFQWKPVKGPSQCHWVRDGVVCQSAHLSPTQTSVSLDLYLSAADLTTDLSGLALVKSAANQRAMTERRDRATKLAWGSIQRTRVSLAKHFSLPSAAHVAYFGPMGMLFVGAAIMTSPWMLFMGVAGLAPLFIISSVDKKKLVTHCVQQLGYLAQLLPK